MDRKYKQVTIIFDDKRLPCVFIQSFEGVDVFKTLLRDSIPQAPRRILSSAYDALTEIMRNSIRDNAEKNTLWLLLDDLYAIKIALNVIIRGHRVIGITLDKEV